MSDCYYHGQSPPGPCPDCKAEREAGEKQGTRESTYKDWTPEDHDRSEQKRYRKLRSTD